MVRFLKSCLKTELLAKLCNIYMIKCCGTMTNHMLEEHLMAHKKIQVRFYILVLCACLCVCV